MNGYPTYAIGYGNLFVLMIDSNIATDAMQLAWVTSQLQHLDRVRYRHVIVVLSPSAVLFGAARRTRHRTRGGRVSRTSTCRCSGSITSG